MKRMFIVKVCILLPYLAVYYRLIFTKIMVMVDRPNELRKLSVMKQFKIIVCSSVNG